MSDVTAKSNTLLSSRHGWVDKWLGPAAAVIVVSVVIWLIQINQAVLYQSALIGSNKTATAAAFETSRRDIERNETQLISFREAQVRVLNILDGLERRLTQEETLGAQRHAENEASKLRLVRLEERIHLGGHKINGTHIPKD